MTTEAASWRCNRGMLWLPEFGPINLNKGGFRVCVSGYRGPYTASSGLPCGTLSGTGTGRMEQSASVTMPCSIEAPTDRSSRGWDLNQPNLFPQLAPLFSRSTNVFRFHRRTRLSPEPLDLPPAATAFHGWAALPLLESRPRPQSDSRSH